MEVVLTLQIQCVISAEDEEDYEEKRDEFILSLEEKGINVNIDNEQSDDFEDNFESENDDFDNEDEDDFYNEDEDEDD